LSKEVFGGFALKQETVIRAKSSKSIGLNESEKNEVAIFSMPTVIIGGKRMSSTGEHLQPSKEREVLAELFKLLEDYSPAWYTEAHHDRLRALLLDKSGHS
jgi:hypothetical protein